MASPRPWLVLALLVSAVGCASTYPTPDTPPPHDFSATAPPDLGDASGGGGGGGDLAVAVNPGSADLAAPAPADLAAPPDLARCLLSADEDGGVTTALYLAAPAAGALFAARFDGSAWTVLPSTPAAVDDVALAAVAGRPLVAARLHDGTLAAGTLDGCRGTFAPMAAIAAGAATSVRPALVGGSRGDLVFRGAVNGDQRYYWARFDGSAWGAIATEGNLLSALTPAAVRENSVVHAIFTGTDGNLWDGTVQATGGGTATQLVGNTSALAPAAAVAPDGTVHVVYTGTNHHVYWFVASTPQTVHDLCDGQGSNCYIVTDTSPALAIGSDGAPTVVFHGTDGKLYASRLAGTQWGAAALVSGSDTTALPPALVGGAAGGLADVVWVRDGDKAARHARLTDAGWQPALTVAAAALTGAPALTVAP